MEGENNMYNIDDNRFKYMSKLFLMMINSKLIK